MTNLFVHKNSFLCFKRIFISSIFSDILLSGKCSILSSFTTKHQISGCCIGQWKLPQKFFEPNPILLPLLLNIETCWYFEKQQKEIYIVYFFILIGQNTIHAVQPVDWSLTWFVQNKDKKLFVKTLIPLRRHFRITFCIAILNRSLLLHIYYFSNDCINFL